MRKLIVWSLIILHLGCISADPKETKYKVNDDSIQWNYNNPIHYENDRFLINLYLSNDTENIFTKIFYKYAVDGDKSALSYLSNNYDICLIDIHNKTNAELIIDLNKIKLLKDKISINVYSPLDIPAQIERLNPKGITKNIYNTIAAIIVTAAIIVLLSQGGAGCLSVPAPQDSSLKSGRNEKKEEKPDDYKKYGIFSSLFHKTDYDYDDCIIDTNIIQPVSHKSGLVFVKKGFINSKIKIIYE